MLTVAAIGQPQLTELGGQEGSGYEIGAGIAMETLYRVPFLVLECPNIKLKRPSWVHMPSAMTVYALVVVSYFLITGGNAKESEGLKPMG